MTYILTTESGSIYKLDISRKRWERLSHSPESNELRSATGAFLNCGTPKVGEPLTMFCPPFEGSCAVARIIQTSPVTEIKMEDELEAAKA